MLERKRSKVVFVSSGFSNDKELSLGENLSKQWRSVSHFYIYIYIHVHPIMFNPLRCDWYIKKRGTPSVELTFQKHKYKWRVWISLFDDQSGVTFFKHHNKFSYPRRACISWPKAAVSPLDWAPASATARASALARPENASWSISASLFASSEERDMIISYKFDINLNMYIYIWYRYVDSYMEKVIVAWVLQICSLLHK